MSTVIGVVENDSVWIGADSRVTTEVGLIRPVSAVKIFRNDGFLFGYTGSIRTGQLLYPELFKPPETIFKLVHEIVEYFTKSGCIIYSGERMQLQASNFLIAFQGKLYELLMDFQLNPVPQYTAIGSGSDHALGCLYELFNHNPSLPAKEKIMRSLNAAAQFDSSSGPPFVVEKL